MNNSYLLYRVWYKYKIDVQWILVLHTPEAKNNDNFLGLQLRYEGIQM